MPRVHLWIAGHVQGVWFRESTRKEAERLGIVGWVRNLEDGRVEAVAEGTRDALDDLVAWCRTGPANARVDDLEAAWEHADEGFDSFEVRR